MKVTYIGPIDKVELTDGQIVRRGETVEVAEELGPRLLEQTENFRPVPEPADKELTAPKRGRR